MVFLFGSSILTLNSSRYASSSSFIIDLCCFHSIIYSSSGTCVYCSTSSISTRISRTLFINNKNTKNSVGTLYLVCQNSLLENVGFTNCSNYQCSAFSISASNYSSMTCISCIECEAEHYYNSYGYNKNIVDSANFSNNQALCCAAFRLGYKSKCSFAYISSTSSITGATVEISDAVLSYTIVIQNSFGSQYGLLRVSYTNSALEYLSIFYNYGSNYITAHVSTFRVTNCISDQPQSAFTSCYDFAGCLFSQTTFATHKWNNIECVRIRDEIATRSSYSKGRLFLSFAILLNY